MAGFPIRDVWGVACPKCHAPIGVRCRDLRIGRWGCNLFGRRTHRERAQALRIARLDTRAPRRFMLWEPPQYVRYTQAPTQTLAVNFTALTNSVATFNQRMADLASVTYTTADTLRTYQDTQWNRWVTTNTTTGAYGYVHDETLERFNGTGIHWEWTQPTTNYYQDYVYNQWQVIHDREVPTPEELQRREDEAQRLREEASRRRLEAQQRWEQEERERALAHDRGLELLNMILTPDQRQERVEKGTITVEGSDGGIFVVDTTYGGVHGNVYEIDAHGCRLGRICIAPEMRVDGKALPLSDGWVGQVLSIQADEAEFRRVGNWSGRRACAHPDVPILGERAA